MNSHNTAFALSRREGVKFGEPRCFVRQADELESWGDPAASCWGADHHTEALVWSITYRINNVTHLLA